MSNVFIMVEAVAGSNVMWCLGDMAQLSQRFGIPVGCRMNGVLAIVNPGDDLGQVYRMWNEELDARKATAPAAEGGV